MSDNHFAIINNNTNSDEILIEIKSVGNVNCYNKYIEEATKYAKDMLHDSYFHIREDEDATLVARIPVAPRIIEVWYDYDSPQISYKILELTSFKFISNSTRYFADMNVVVDSNGMTIYDDNDEPYTFDEYEKLSQLMGGDDYIAIDVYMYEHSGIIISTWPNSCVWDSGLFGIFYITKEEADKLGLSRNEVIDEMVEFVNGPWRNVIEGNIWYARYGDDAVCGIISDMNDLPDYLLHEFGIADAIINKEPYYTTDNVYVYELEPKNGGGQ